jgi:hypothetical protein
MVTSTKRLRRRTVLCGIGVAMAWPVLEEVGPLLALSAPGPRGLPRAGVFYAGAGMFLPEEYRTQFIALELVRE